MQSLQMTNQFLDKLLVHDNDNEDDHRLFEGSILKLVVQTGRGMANVPSKPAHQIHKDSTTQIGRMIVSLST